MSQSISGLVGVVARLGALLDLGGIAGQHESDVAHAVLDAAGEVALAEARQDRILDDDLGQRIGERALEPAADLDADLALIGRDDEEDAIVAASRCRCPNGGRADSRNPRWCSLAATAT